jgi:hypothetical protein
MGNLIECTFGCNFCDSNEEMTEIDLHTGQSQTRKIQVALQID